MTKKVYFGVSAILVHSGHLNAIKRVAKLGETGIDLQRDSLLVRDVG